MKVGTYLLNTSTHCLPKGTKVVNPDGDVYEVTTVRMWGYHLRNIATGENTTFTPNVHVNTWDMYE